MNQGMLNVLTRSRTSANRSSGIQLNTLTQAAGSPRKQRVPEMAIGIALVNAQVAIYAQMEVVLSESAYGTLFYAITGTMLALIAIGMVFTAVAFFRSVGGRDDDLQVVSANALYWYFLTAAFTAVWFFVYVQK